MVSVGRSERALKEGGPVENQIGRSSWDSVQMIMKPALSKKKCQGTHDTQYFDALYAWEFVKINFA